MTLGSSKFHFVSALDCLLQSGRNRPNYVSILVWRNFTLFYLSKTFNIVLQDLSRLIFHLDGHFNFSTLVSSWTWGSIDFLGVGCSGAISPTRASIPPWNPTRTDQVQTKQSTDDQALLLRNPKAFEMRSDQYVSSGHDLVVCQTEGAICCEGKDLNYWLCLGPKTEP